jgi:hypothetical protein
MPAVEACICLLPICAKRVVSPHKTTELLFLENALLLPLPLKLNPTQLKHCGSLHKGTDALEHDFGGIFPGCEWLLNMETTTQVLKNKNSPDGNGAIQ